MKRFLVIMVCICMIMSTCSYAEEEKDPGFFESVGNWFGQAWNDSTAWVSQAWTDSTTWVSNAWGDSGKWISQAWNDSSKWISDIWGDASTWAADTYTNVSGSVSTWWEETFNKTEALDEVWTKNDNVARAFESLKEYLIEQGLSAINENDLGNNISVHEINSQLLKKLNLNDSDVKKVLDTIQAYSEQKGLSVSSVEAIMLPYLLQLTVDSETVGNVNIPAIAVAQYLTGVIEKLGIKSEEDAQLLAARVNKIFGE